MNRSREAIKAYWEWKADVKRRAKATARWNRLTQSKIQIGPLKTTVARLMDDGLRMGEDGFNQTIRILKGQE
jgi:hypothetical protein